MGWDGNLCVGLFYEHRFAVLIKTVSFVSGGPYGPRGVLSDFEGGGVPKVYIRTDPGFEI